MTKKTKKSAAKKTVVGVSKRFADLTDVWDEQGRRVHPPSGSAYDYDIIFYDTIGNAFTRESLKTQPSGAAEIAIVKYAHWLAEQGYSVLVLNGVGGSSVDAGVTYDSSIEGFGYGEVSCRALVISRYSKIPNIKAERTIVWSVDAHPASHTHQRELFESKKATLHLKLLLRYLL